MIGGVALIPSVYCGVNAFSKVHLLGWLEKIQKMFWASWILLLRSFPFKNTPHTWESRQLMATPSPGGFLQYVGNDSRNGTLGASGLSTSSPVLQSFWKLTLLSSLGGFAERWSRLYHRWPALKHLLLRQPGYQHFLRKRHWNRYGNQLNSLTRALILLCMQKAWSTLQHCMQKLCRMYLQLWIESSK